jgi:hypothetical protein
MNPDPIAVALSFARILEELGIRYLIGGSVASTFLGEPRSTQDVDFVLHLEPGQTEPLIRRLQSSEFLFHPHAVREALTGWRFFTLVHNKLFVKVDCYLRPDEGIHREEMRRAQRARIGSGPADFVYVASPEDTVLQKLLWYRMGDEVSDRQWRDVVGVLKGRGADIDRSYLDRWARELQLSELLHRALHEAGLEPLEASDNDS